MLNEAKLEACNTHLNSCIEELRKINSWVYNISFAIDSEEYNNATVWDPEKLKHIAIELEEINNTLDRSKGTLKILEEVRISYIEACQEDL